MSTVSPHAASGQYPPAAANSNRGTNYARLLALLVLVGWAMFVGYPSLLEPFGISVFGTPFLDSYAILAAVDAVRNGADPHLANHLDPLMRGHVYSDWWLALKYTGLTRADNGFVAIAWISAFGIVAVCTGRTRNWGETLWMFFLLMSPPVMLAVTRGNNDLVIFVLLAGCSLPAEASRWWRNSLAVGCLILATGLKYFPVAGVLSFLWIRPVNRMPAVLLAALAGVFLAMKLVAGEIARGRFFVPSGLHTIGAALFWRDFGWKDAESLAPNLIIIAGAGIGLMVGRVTTGLGSRGTVVDRMRASLGAAVLLACFLGGVSYAYRWIFVIWPAIWLWRQSRDLTTPGRDRRIAAFACILIFSCVWLDGIFCVLVNRVFPPTTELALQHSLITWRHWTQPFPWLLMMLLSGWLTEAAWRTIREWWSLRHDS